MIVTGLGTGKNVIEGFLDMIDFQQLTDRLDRLDAKPVVIVTHRRSGTHLLIDTIRRHFAACRGWKWPMERSARLYLSLESIDNPSVPLPTPTPKAVTVLGRTERPLVKTHVGERFFLNESSQALPALSSPWKHWLSDRSRLIYIHRDGRDVMTSLHLFRQLSSPTARVSFSEFLRQTDRHGRTAPAAWARHVRCWLGDPDVLVLRFRDIMEDTSTVLARVGDYLGLAAEGSSPLLPPKRASIWTARLDRMLRISPPTTAVLGRYRGGEPVKWRQAMTQEDRQFFDEQTDGLLYDLGYESDREWLLAPGQ